MCNCIMVSSGEYNSRAEKHGMKKTKLYQTWKAMKARCFSNKKSKKHYSDRGIMVCKQWSSFLVFYKDMGDKPNDKLSIDRIDNNKGYCPHNCRWATSKEQVNNRNVPKKRNTAGVKSKYPGVNIQTKSNTWYSQISINGKKKYLGSFKTEDEAFMAFCIEYELIHGKKHKLDFFRP